ncbi:hypothetical protein BVX95_00180 [archaeon D22]|nr:hypothetical protein BVX95_00180 [archaeon D22]
MALDEPNHWISLILGFVLTALGIIPLLNAMGVIGFGLPGFMTGLFGSLFGLIVLAGAGVYLLIDSFFEDDFIFWLTLIISLIIVVIGLIPILFNFGIIGFNIPFGATIYQILFAIEGFLLIIAAFAMN